MKHRQILPGQSATTMQVAGSVVAAVQWLIDCPNERRNVPRRSAMAKTACRHEPLHRAKVHSEPVEWTPLATRVNLFLTLATTPA